MILVFGVATCLVVMMAPNETAAGNRYVGAKRCQRCHDGADKGNQYSKWHKGKHAQAFKTLGTAKAKKIGAKSGISNPQTSPKCLRCHETGHGKSKDQLGKSFKTGIGVQCESCHGPSEKHFRDRFEAEQEDDEDEDYEDEDDPDDEVLMSLPKGELTPVTEKLCNTCHNKDSPSHKPICYCKSVKELSHFDPRRETKRGDKTFAKKPCACE